MHGLQNGKNADGGDDSKTTANQNSSMNVLIIICCYLALLLIWVGAAVVYSGEQPGLLSPT